jgi:endonuclease/exonuclease/phosphatase family metal-dependent hydrolase
VYSTDVARPLGRSLSFSLALCLLSPAACVVQAREPARPAPPVACSRSNLVVATYNVRYDTPKDREHRWSRRREQVGELIRSLRADIIGLQEVEVQQLDDLRPMLPGYLYEGVGRDDGANGGEFTPLFYSETRFQREDGGTFWLSPTPDRPRGRWEFKPWGAGHNRIATWLLLRDKASDDLFLVVNTHFDYRSARARLESARLLVRFIRQRTADHIILMGDLNARPRSEPLRILSTALRNTLTAPWRRRPPHRSSMTMWTRLDQPGHHIDHIFVSADVRPLTYEVIDRRLVYSGAPRYTSDHLPVRTDLCFASKPRTARGR